MSISLPIIWLAATIIFVVVEAATLGLTSIWFAVGALAALIASLLHASLLIQGILFILISALMLVMLRPLSKKVFQVGREKTNADRVIGMTGTVTEEIDNCRPSGQVRVGGQIWTARAAEEGTTFPVGAQVTVQAIAGVKVIVK